MQEPLLDIRQLSIEFPSEEGWKTVINDVSFSVYPGECLGIVGESGSGKSITCLSAMGLLGKGRIASGSIWFKGKEITNLDTSDYRALRGKKIAMVFQEPMSSLNPLMTCGKQVAEAILSDTSINKKTAYEQTIALFEEVKLPDPEKIANAYPHEISGGQKQRVMIAMAISQYPDLLIADEPTTALDVTVQATIIELLADLQKTRNMSILFISHDLSLVSQIAQQVVVMYKGQIAENKDVYSLFTKPDNNYTKALFSCRPSGQKKGQRLPVIADFLEEKIQNKINIESIHQTFPVLNKKIMEVKGLKTYFFEKNFFGKIIKTFKAVDDVSFDVYQGETLGIVGESGCGKSTLSRTLLRLVPATAGEVIYEGKDLMQISQSEMQAYKQRLQIVFQDPYSALNPRQLIGDAICEVMEVHNIGASKQERYEMMQDLLTKVGLTKEHAQRYPHEFSGGQRQRICIARTLSLKPELIIFDESVAALDVSVQAQILNLLNDLKKEYNFTCVFISHDLSVVRYMSDRIIVMNKGKIEEQAEAEKIFNYPNSAYTKQLISAIPEVNIEGLALTNKFR